jgi:hypothetical protein
MSNIAAMTEPLRGKSFYSEASESTEKPTTLYTDISLKFNAETLTRFSTTG